MGTNSIRENLTKTDIISEIRLSLGADIKNELVFMLVEGLDDIKFWRNIVNDRVVILESFSGKTGILEIIQNYFDTEPQVIGVRDKDYESDYIHSKIFYYDYSCMEIMFILNDEAFSSIYSEYYDGEYTPRELREMIFWELKYLSLIRKNNEINGWGIKFDGLSIFNVFNMCTKKVEIEKIIHRLNEINKNYFEKNPYKLFIINNDNSVRFKYEDIVFITQGHDFISLFTAFCFKPKGKAVSDKNIASSLRCAYRKSDFVNTVLFSMLTEYEQKYNLKIVS